jgi:glycerol kinase
MSQSIYLGIDHGGSTTTALALGSEGEVLGSYSVPMPKQTPQIGWVEHDPNDFVSTSREACAGVLHEIGLTWKQVAAVGFANQGETSIVWSARTGRSLGPAMSWEDRRTAAMCEQLATEGVDRLIRERTGIILDPYFSASKYKWLIENEPLVSDAASKGELRLGGTDSYTIWSMTEGETHAIDAGTASRTALFNLRDVSWDNDLLEAFGLEPHMLAEIRPTAGNFGTIKKSDDRVEIPITANVVDCHAALFAQGCWDPSIIKATYGTGAFIDINTGSEPPEPDGLLPVYIGWDLGSGAQYMLEGGVFSVGSAIDWCVRSGLLPTAQESSDLASTVPDSGGVTMLSCFAGLAAPHWQTSARATLTGMGLDTTPAHIAHALLEGIAFRCCEVIEALNQRIDNKVIEVRADGGPTRNPFLMQRQADLLGMPVRVSLEPNMTALGAALLAALGAGHFTLDYIRSMEVKHEVYEPVMSDVERASRWDKWREDFDRLVSPLPGAIVS